MGDISDFTHGLKMGMATDTSFGALMPPLYPSASYTFSHLGDDPAYDYSRVANPTRHMLGEAIAKLEKGVGATVTSSGMSALLLAMDAFVPVGGRVVAPLDCYGGTWRLLDCWHQQGRVRTDFVDLVDDASARQALSEPADLVLIESPSNPLLRITDIVRVSALAHEAGALVIVDNTIVSPVLQQPLMLGADLVVNSTTKFINGHSDVVGGAVVAADPAHDERLHFWAKVIGVTASAWDSWLTLRGLRTIEARVRVHLDNARQIVDVLTSHPAVEKVYYPGLDSHPQHELAAQQMSGFGSLVSFEVAGGMPAAQRLVASLELFDLAESLGGVESLVAHPASMTHAGMTQEARDAAGVTEGLLRLSVGIEPVADLVADLGRGLAAASL